MKKFIIAIVALISLSACGANEPTAIEAVQITPEVGARADVVEFTEDSFIIGNGTKTVTIYQDFNCPHCKDLHGLMDDKIEEWLSSDTAVEYKLMDYLSPGTKHEFSMRGANALTLVADRYPDYVLEAQDELFDLQPRYNNSEVSDESIIEAVEDAGVKLTDKDKSDIKGLAYHKWIRANADKAKEAGITYIPRVAVDGELLEFNTFDELFETLG